jgi:hypothetical protein
MTAMRKAFFENICSTNGIDKTNLSPIEVEFRALGFLGYTVGTINDRRRAFYQSRTGLSFLVDAIHANNPNE